MLIGVASIPTLNSVFVDDFDTQQSTWCGDFRSLCSGNWARRFTEWRIDPTHIDEIGTTVDVQHIELLNSSIVSPMSKIAIVSCLSHTLSGSSKNRCRTGMIIWSTSRN